jgi:predicted acylesterase/phospholipase RssA
MEGVGETDLSTADYSRPSRTCDVVMKGGITSGVVYPHAVCTLARSYRFRNVGGTSAGAIAAAATAAAEYGRAEGGFRRLAALPEWMGSDGNLLGLFQPQAPTAGLFAVLIGALEGGPGKACVVALRRYPLAALLGGALGLALFVLALVRGIGDGFDALVLVGILAGLLLTLLGAALGVAVRLARQLTRGVADNGFGLCSGGPGAGAGEGPALTPWLTTLLNETAGLPPEEPLTFAHLWAGPGGDREAPPEDPEARELQLAMMTTNLVNRRAHRLPWDNRQWFFDPDEFRRLFGPEVVEWMVAHPPPDLDDSEQARARREQALPRLPLPAAADLPVVVATRMSLSFPVLLSGVPLWRFDYTRPAPRPLERCWFSDGGISSNFPVHFFDRLVPRWPTFAINLRPFALGQVPSETDQAANTSMVTTNAEGIADWWYRLPERPGGLGLLDKRLFAFLSSAVRTMQNRLDEAQMRVPGYRDRIAHVSLAEDEGGMNLTMPPARIEALTARGRAAAERLHDAYTPPDAPDQTITWDNHRWVRLRSSLAVLERMHDHFADGYSQPPASPGESTYAELLARGPDVPPKSYRWDDEVQRGLAGDEIEAILGAAAENDPERSVARGAPQPAPEGRIAPTE